MNYQEELRKGDRYAEAGDLERAEKIGRRLLRVDPRQPGGDLLLGKTLMKRRHFDQAMKVYRNALQKVSARPHQFIVHNAMGACAFRQGDYAEAIRHYRICRELMPTETANLESLALACLQAGRGLRRARSTRSCCVFAGSAPCTCTTWPPPSSMRVTGCKPWSGSIAC